MSAISKAALPLFLVLGLVGWGTAIAVEQRCASWLERDACELAEGRFEASREVLVESWCSGDDRALEAALGVLVLDGPLAAAAALDASGRVRAATDGFSAELAHLQGAPVLTGDDGDQVGTAADGADGADRAEPSAPLAHARTRTRTEPDPSGVTWDELPSASDVAGRAGSVDAADRSHGPLLAGRAALVDPSGEAAPGTLLLLADLGAARGEAERLGDLVFAVLLALAFGVAALVVVVQRRWRRTWTDEMRSAVAGGEAAPEVAALVAELRAEAETPPGAGDDGQETWNATRLRRTLRQHLHREKVLIVANREPYIHERTEEGAIQVRHPASGLVSALEPVMRACSGVWVAHGSGSADREVVDRHDRIRVPPGEGSYVLRRVWLTRDEEQGYYYGFANEGLWPLCHIAHTRPVFRREDWEAYRHVNARFAEAACDESDTDDPIVFVQDYHFALAPGELRKRLPRATILTFWHIPWPNAENFGICPWPREILAGLLGSSILGFHTQLHCNNFLDCVDRHLEARIDREEQAVIHRGRKTLVRAYPISVEWPSRWAQQAEPVEECREMLRARLGLPEDAHVGLGVDRLDYTKGIEERLLAVECLLEKHPEHVGRYTFVQIAAPSRTAIDTYQHLNEQVERVVARINARFGDGRWQPIVLLREHHDPPSIYRFYRGADLCYVSSLHDGMNLVAKEFVASRDDEQGVLLLSRFTGAASELKEALVVNPYDVEQAAGAMHLALEMDEQEQRARMQAMRGFLAEFNVYRWAGDMIEDAARLREQERVADRLEELSDLPDEPQGARA